MKMKKLNNENRKLIKLCSQLKVDLNRVENFSFSNSNLNFNTMRNFEHGNLRLTKNDDENNNILEKNNSIEEIIKEENNDNQNDVVNTEQINKSNLNDNKMNSNNINISSNSINDDFEKETPQRKLRLLKRNKMPEEVKTHSPLVGMDFL